MSPETMALTLLVVVIFSMVPSQLASELSVIPKCDIFYKKKNNINPKGISKCDIFYTKNNNNPTGITCSNIGVSKEYSFC